MTNKIKDRVYTSFDPYNSENAEVSRTVPNELYDNLDEEQREIRLFGLTEKEVSKRGWKTYALCALITACSFGSCLFAEGASREGYLIKRDVVMNFAQYKSERRLKRGEGYQSLTWYGLDQDGDLKIDHIVKYLGRRTEPQYFNADSPQFIEELANLQKYLIQSPN